MATRILMRLHLIWIVKKKAVLAICRLIVRPYGVLLPCHGVLCNIFSPDKTQYANDKIAQSGHYTRSGLFANLRSILIKSYITNIMAFIFNTPMSAARLRRRSESALAGDNIFWQIFQTLVSFREKSNWQLCSMCLENS